MKKTVKSDIPTVLPPSAWKVKETYLEQLLQNPWYAAISQISSAIYGSTHTFFEERGVNPFLFPITTGSVSSPMGLGSDSLPVKVKLRAHEIFLADSMQFSLEVGARLNNGSGAYYIMPTFRGEPVDERHLNEFNHAEAEIKGGLNDVMKLAEDYVTFTVDTLSTRCKAQIVDTAGSLEHVSNFLSKKSFHRVRYEDAIKELSSIPDALENTGTGHPSITSSGEKELLRHYGDFTWVTHMPWANVPFYQAKEPNTPYSMTADLLMGIGETLGCGQRVDTRTALEESLEFHGVSLDGYRWYSDMRELSPLQTAGFGLGIERLILWLTQTSDIRNCSLIYRDHDQVFFP